MYANKNWLRYLTSKCNKHTSAAFNLAQPIKSWAKAICIEFIKLSYYIIINYDIIFTWSIFRLY